MDSRTLKILVDPPAGSHIVYPCSDDGRVVDAITIYTTSGLEAGDAVVLITTEGHRQTVMDRLKADGYAVERFISQGQLVFIDAADLLACITPAGTPDSGIFAPIFEDILRKSARDPGTGRSRRVRLFGEMVSLLWGAKSECALRLEEMWNRLIEGRSCPLLCTYTLDGSSLDHGMPAVAALHSHTIGEYCGCAENFH